MKNKKIISIIFICLAITIFIVDILIFLNSSSTRLKKQLDLGQKFLTKQDYENAVATFKVAISIDPASVEAYIGVADAYLGLNDKNSARQILNQGIKYLSDNSGSEEDINILKEKLSSIVDIQVETDINNDDTNDNIEPQVNVGNPSIDLDFLLSYSKIKGKLWYEWDPDELVSAFSINEKTELLTNKNDTTGTIDTYYVYSTPKKECMLYEYISSPRWSFIYHAQDLNLSPSLSIGLEPEQPNEIYMIQHGGINAYEGSLMEFFYKQGITDIDGLIDYFDINMSQSSPQTWYSADEKYYIVINLFLENTEPDYVFISFYNVEKNAEEYSFSFTKSSYDNELEVRIVYHR